MMKTVLHRLAQWAETSPKAVAQSYKKNGEWNHITASEYRDRVFHLALFLESRGFGASDVGVIFSYNSPPWTHVHLAMMLLGGKSTGIYPNTTQREIAYIIEHSEARVLSVQNKDYFAKILGKSGDTSILDGFDLIIVFDGDTSISPKAVAYEAAIEEGRRLAKLPGSKRLRHFLDALDPLSSAFIIYTSGTTGNPKGALLSHWNLAFTSDVATKAWDLPLDGIMFSFLPLCHIAETIHSLGVGITNRCHVYFATRFENFSSELVEVQPTLLLSVPRLWEKMMEGVMQKLDHMKGTKKQLARWAMHIGRKVAHLEYMGKPISPVTRGMYSTADRTVLQKIREALGLGRARTLGSGAAALPAHVSRWFRGIGLEILEDYGQTESTGVICMTERGMESAGTVGKPVPGIQFRIAEDGEILIKGPNVFLGYYKDEANTAETLVDGWLHTGDLGEITERGLVKIKGRKKEILKTSGGKMVAPLPIEEKIKASRMISHVCIVGDNRRHLSALITLEEKTLGNLQAKPGAIIDGLIRDEAVIKEVRKSLDEVNRTLATYEQIKRFAILSKEFSIEAGEMTPTLKMKRGVIEKNYRHIIDALYH